MNFIFNKDYNKLCQHLDNVHCSLEVLDNFMETAIDNSDTIAINILIKHGANSYNKYLAYASYVSNKFDICEIFIQLGATNIYNTACYCIDTGKFDILKGLIARGYIGSDTHKKLLRYAIIGRKEPMIKFMLNSCDYNLDAYHRLAIAFNDDDVSKTIKRHIEKQQNGFVYIT